jgi:hypothetical protein
LAFADDNQADQAEQPAGDVVDQHTVDSVFIRIITCALSDFVRRKLGQVRMKVPRRKRFTRKKGRRPIPKRAGVSSADEVRVNKLWVTIALLLVLLVAQLFYFFPTA